MTLLFIFFPDKSYSENVFVIIINKSNPIENITIEELGLGEYGEEEKEKVSYEGIYNLVLFLIIILILLGIQYKKNRVLSIVGCAFDINKATILLFLWCFYIIVWVVFMEKSTNKIHGHLCFNIVRINFRR